MNFPDASGNLQQAISQARVGASQRQHKLPTGRVSKSKAEVKQRFLGWLTPLAWLLLTSPVAVFIPLPHTPAADDMPAVQSDDVATEPGATTADDRLGKPDAAPFTLAGKVLNVAGVPEAGARVLAVSRFAEVDASVTSDEQGEFSFRLRAEGNAVLGLRISAVSSDGSQFGFFRIPQSVTQGALEQISIQLEPARIARVRVVDLAGNPLQGARVALQLNYPVTAGPIETDASGLATFQIPESESIQSVVAWKDARGLDYRVYSLPRDQEGDRFTKPPVFPSDSQETLCLEGAAPLSVRITDTQGEAIEGAQTYVWLLRKNSGEEQLNLSYFTDAFMATSDTSGRVTFDWFPIWQEEITTIWPSADGFVQARGNYDPASKTGELAIQLDRLIPIRGTVRFADGKPAANITISASGAGYTFDGFRGNGKTSELGDYEILAAPHQIYMLYVTDEKWSAASQSGFALLPGKVVAEKDFVLRRATRIHGRVLNQETGEPVSGQLLYLTHHGIDLNAMGDHVLPNPEDSKKWVCPMQQLNMMSGPQGEFEFFVGDGEYNLFIQGFDGEKLTIDGDEERLVDLRIAVQTKAAFTGLVVDDDSNAPVAGAKVQAVSRNFRQHNDWQATTTAQGKFQVERFREASYLHIVDTEEKYGAISEITADETIVVVRLRRLGSARGRLLTEDGKAPAAGTKLLFGIRIQDEANRLSTSRFGKVVTCDANGMFTLPNLVPGWEYECTLHEHPSGFVLNVAQVKVEVGQTVELGDLKTPAPKQ